MVRVLVDLSRFEEYAARGRATTRIAGGGEIVAERPGGRDLAPGGQSSW